MDDSSRQFRNDLSSCSVQQQPSSNYEPHHKSSSRYLTDSDQTFANGNRQVGMSSYDHYKNGGDADRTLYGAATNLNRTDGEVYRPKPTTNYYCPLSPPAPPNSVRPESPPMSNYKSPPNCHYQRAMSPPKTDYRPISPPKQNFRPITPPKANYRAQSPHKTKHSQQNESTNLLYSRAQSPRNANYRSKSSPKSYQPKSPTHHEKYTRPQSPTKTNFRSISPLPAEYPTHVSYPRPISPPKMNYRPKTPPYVNYCQRPKSPHKNYQSRSPVKTNYPEWKSPRTIKYSREKKPPTTNHRSNTPPKHSHSRAKSPPVESYAHPGTSRAPNFDYGHRQMSPNKNACQHQSRKKAPLANETTSKEIESTANGKLNFDTKSLLGGMAESVDSGKTRKTSSTTVRRSAHDLRKVVKTQCKIYDVIDETIKQMAEDVSSDADDLFNRQMKEKELEYKKQVQKHMAELKHLSKISSDTIITAKPSLIEKSSQTCELKEDSENLLTLHKNRVEKKEKNFLKGDEEDMGHVLYRADNFTVTMGDVVNSRVVNPMMRKIHRMQINNLRGEMSLLEDLERLPSKVNQYYSTNVKGRKDNASREQYNGKEEERIKKECAGKPRK